jgi:hypothetical protein
MSTRLFRASLAAATLLAAAGWCPPAGAKPPDLPMKTEDDCKEPPAPDDGPHGSLTIGFDVLRGGITFQVQSTEECQDTRDCTGFVPAPGVLPCLQPFVGLPVPTVSFSVEDKGGTEESSDEDPFVSMPLLPCVPPCWGGPDSGANERRDAREDIWSPFWYMYQGADTDPGEKGPKSEGPETTCPYLKERAEEKKPEPVDPAELENSVLEKLDQLEVAGRLLRLADYYRSRGDTAAACQLYRKVQRLCPGSRYDRMAASRLGELFAAPPEEKGDSPPPQPEDGPDNPAEPEQSFAHPLPAIDPEVAAALEKVLAGAADPLPAKLVILREEKDKADGQEPPALPWPGGLPPVAFPSLLVEAEDPDLAARDGEEAEEPGQPAEPAPDLNAVLREVIEAVGSGVSIDIDSSREDCLRAACEVEVGGVEFKLIWSDTGQRLAVVRLLPEACPDLRAVERAHSDWVIEWIQALSGNGDYDSAPPQAEPWSFDAQEWEDEDDVELPLLF